MGRSMTIGGGIATTLIVFVFMIAYGDNYHAETTIFIKPNNTTTAVQADHVINNIVVIPERDDFKNDLIEDLSETTIDNWNEHIRTKRTLQTGYITINIRSSSFEQSEAIAIAAVRLWIKNIKEYYKITDEIEVKIVAHELRRGSWREFTLAIIFSLLIGVLVTLIASLVHNTFIPHTKKHSSKPIVTTQTRKSDVPKFEQISTDKSSYNAQQKFRMPLFIKKSKTENDNAPIASYDEENARIRLHHARAEERNFIAATTKTKLRQSTNDGPEQVKDVFDTYNSFQHPLGAEGIGKSSITDTAPDNLPIAETTAAFSDTPVNLQATKKKQSETNQMSSTDQSHISKRSDELQPTKKAVNRLENVIIAPKQNETKKPKENSQTEKMPKTLPAQTENNRINDAPLNLPIVGVTGKTTASKIQENKSKFTFTPPISKQRKVKETSEEPGDLEREPTDKELKERLNQLLKGNFKTK